jgi:hypothetical protein
MAIFMYGADGSINPSKIWLIRPNGQKLVVMRDYLCQWSHAFSDQTQLYITESTSHWVWIYKIKPDGTLEFKQRYGWLHEPDAARMHGQTD